MTNHRHHRTIAIRSNQFEPIAFGWFREHARRHHGLVRTAIPEVSQPKAVPYFVQHDGSLIGLRECGKIVWVNTYETRAIREGSRPRHALAVDALRWLVELCGNRNGEPHTPEKKRDTNKYVHATDRRSLRDVLRQQIPIVAITTPDQSVRAVT